MIGKKIRPYSLEWKNLDAQSVDETKGEGLAFNDCRQVDYMVKTSAGVSAGKVVFENATEKDYAGTWNPLMEVDCADLGASAELGGTFPDPPGGFTRSRISEAIVGGTITTFLNGLLQ